MRNTLPFHFFQVHVQLENLKPVGKCVESELLSISWLKNLGRLSLIMCL